MGGGIFVYANPFRIAVMVVMPVTNSPMSLFCLYRLSNFLSWDNSDSDVNIPSYLKMTPKRKHKSFPYENNMKLQIPILKNREVPKYPSNINLNSQKKGRQNLI